MFFSGLRKTFTRVVLPLVLAHVPLQSSAIEMSNRFRSPRNPERKVRQSTELIVLHTTEAPARSSLNKLCDRGECHFCVTEEGRIYRIVDRDREAFHAGRSMWNGKEDVDKFSIGIECVGYHNKPMSSVQIAAIRNLLVELKAMYRITDDRVLCHSHVAYGAPNKWHRCKHRGRKRCGMLFATTSVRQILGLKSKPAMDRDVKARRLVVGDDYLHRVLYGGVDPMRRSYSGVSSGSSNAIIQSKTLKQVSTIAPPKVDDKSKIAPVGNAKLSDKLKWTPKMTASKASISSIADLKAAGYSTIGTISKDKTAISIAGNKWNSPDTYYVIRGKVTSGQGIDASKLEKGMSVWRKK